MSKADKYSEISVGDPQESGRRARRKEKAVISEGKFELGPGKKHQRYVLARRVMAVAVYDEAVGDWAAYIDAVPGNNHSEEWQEVVDHGLKLPKRLAEVMFPLLATNEKMMWRD